MEQILNPLRTLLSAHHYLEIDCSISTSTIAVVYALQSVLDQRIHVRLVHVPLSSEVLIYIKAQHLGPKILTLKVQVSTSYPSAMRGIIVRGIIIALFPPPSEAPALPHLPDSALHHIGSYLHVRV